LTVRSISPMELNSDFASRIDAAVSAWKTKLKIEREKSSAGDTQGPNGIPSLRGAAADLERDLANVLEQIAVETARARVLESRAMDVVRTHDYRGARDAFRAHEECVEALKQLAANATVIRAMIAECHAMLDQLGE
jgi:hypothetical protein